MGMRPTRNRRTRRATAAFRVMRASGAQPSLLPTAAAAPLQNVVVRRGSR